MNNRVILSPPEAKDIKLSSGQSLEDSINNLNNAIRELQNLQVGGRNLYLDTKNFSSPSAWANYDFWQKTGETYNGFTVISNKSESEGTCQQISAKEGEVYTFSAYIKNVDSVAAIYTSSPADFGYAETSPAFMSIPQSTDFVRYAFTFRVMTSGIITPMVEGYKAEANKIKICGLKLERGNVATDWSPAPEDMYPIGSIYISTIGTSPASLFGGTWVQLKDRFLLAAGDTYEAGSTGGEAKHTLTVDEMPSHTHFSNDGWDGYTNASYRIKTTNFLTYGKNTSGVHDYPYFSKNTRLDSTFSSTGKNQPHNNLPPYLTVYMWKRIA